MRVVLAGAGYVGLVVAVAAAEAGHLVAVVDPDHEKVRKLRRHESYIEDVTDEQLQAVSSNLVAFSSLPGDMDAFDIAIIAVPTPLRDGVPDLTYVRQAGREIGLRLNPGACVVLESTTYPGTTEGILRDVLEGVSDLEAGRDFMLGFSPERIDPGNKVHTFKNTPKIVSGIDRQSADFIEQFYGSIVDTTVRVDSPELAELTKLWENIYADVNIALVNEMAQLCEKMGVSVWDMIAAGFTKGHSMGDFPWMPGPGVGGHCLPIDPHYLDWRMKTEHDTPFRFAQLARHINDGMPDYVVQRAQDILNWRKKALCGSRILVLGVAYKPGTGDTRESPSLELVYKLTGKGAEVTISDPHVQGPATLRSVRPDRISGELSSYPYDLVIVATAHPEFDYEKIGYDSLVPVLDCRNVVPDGENVTRL